MVGTKFVSTWAGKLPGLVIANAHPRQALQMAGTLKRPDVPATTSRDDTCKKHNVKISHQGSETSAPRNASPYTSS